MELKEKVLACHAKINIGLRILGRRPEDGFHVLETIFQEVDFGDDLSIKPLPFHGGERFSLSCNWDEIPCDGRNLVLKAAVAMEKYLPADLGLSFHLEKRIPVGAGLGGGSSNAAAVLKYINDLAGLDDEELAGIAVTLGADVPFFLRGGTAYATGIGDELQPVTIDKNWFCVLVFPGISVSTVWAYSQLKISLTESMKSTKILSYLGNDFKWRLFENNFENVVHPAYPRIGKIKEDLLRAGAEYASLSGSGSTVFGVCETYKKAQELCGQFSNALVAVPI